MDAPSKINQTEKLRLLRGEGVEFDAQMRIVDRGRLWDNFRV